MVQLIEAIRTDPESGYLSGSNLLGKRNDAILDGLHI